MVISSGVLDMSPKPRQPVHVRLEHLKPLASKLVLYAAH